MKMKIYEIVVSDPTGERRDLLVSRLFLRLEDAKAEVMRLAEELVKMEGKGQTWESKDESLSPSTKFAFVYEEAENSFNSSPWRTVFFVIEEEVVSSVDFQRSVGQNET